MREMPFRVASGQTKNRPTRPPVSGPLVWGIRRVLNGPGYLLDMGDDDGMCDSFSHTKPALSVIVVARPNQQGSWD